MIFQLSILVNLFCSLPSIVSVFQSTEGQFIEDNEETLKRVINVNKSFLNFNLIDAKILDVQKLNKLISFIDKTWILPHPGAHQPIGSNFKYKKTCANIYQKQKDICQQIGFGTMCFNYCFEQGEILKFQCQNVADSTYCKNNSAFDSFLMRYQNDPYKAKSYIRQMISRCYATAICDTQYGILNTTIIDENNEEWESNNIPTSLNPTTDNSNQQEISQIIRQRLSEISEIQPKRPIPMWQLLLLRHRMTAAAKSFPIVKATENSGLAEVLSEESLKKFENTEITEEKNSKNINIKNSSEYIGEIPTEETTISTKQTVPRKDQNKAQELERFWWLYKMLRRMDKNSDCLRQQ